MKFSAIITAGGSSNRYGSTNKLLEKVNSKEVIRYTVENFLAVEQIDEIVICANVSIIENLKEIFQNESKIRIIEGGDLRQKSVYNGLLALKKEHSAPPDYVLIHDGARPVISPDVLRKVILEVQEKKALTVAVKTTDTIKQVDENLKIIKTVDRSSLYNTQTPQAFEYNLIKEAHEKLSGQNFSDDAGMIEVLGYPVYIVEGDYRNIKITTPNDIQIAKFYLT